MIDVVPKKPHTLTELPEKQEKRVDNDVPDHQLSVEVKESLEKREERKKSVVCEPEKQSANQTEQSKEPEKKADEHNQENHNPQPKPQLKKPLTGIDENTYKDKEEKNGKTRKADKNDVTDERGCCSCLII